MGTSEVMPLMLLSIFYCLYSNSLVLVFAFVDWTTNQNCVFILVRTIIVRFQILQMCIKKIYRNKPRVYTFFH